MKATEQTYLTADLLGVIIARYYEATRGPAMAAIGNCPKWDLKFSDGVTAEVKLDYRGAETGNLAIETWNTKRNIPSGITSTTAELWLHCVPENDKLRVFEINTRVLLKVCIEFAGGVKECGNNNTALVKLIPVSEIRKIANSEFVLDGPLVEFISSQNLKLEKIEEA